MSTRDDPSAFPRTAPRRAPVDRSQVAVQVIGYAVITLFSLFCLFPFVLMITNSFATDASVRANGLRLVPSAFTTLAYKVVLVYNPRQIVGAYIVTSLLTAVGTVFGLFMVGMVGYALQRRDFPIRNGISFFIYFTTLFSGGLIPYYLLVTRYMGLQNNYLAILLPSLMSPFLVILMKSFLKGIPYEVTESAKIDGASDFRIYWSIIQPMALPAMATVGLFLALNYWNEWYNAMLFIPQLKYQPLQLFLYQVINKADFIRSSSAAANIPIQDLPGETLKMAVAVVATGPIILLYPFVQRYFVQGIVVGAVKG
ncbi:MAG TPA: carbohydrate ABC transporter permease [Spirochaetia bacterium]|nr:carbohydrate ABC transporter permease [Spirochaetia bacterium]